MASKGPSEGDGVREFLEREARIAKEREVSELGQWNCIGADLLHVLQEAAKPKELKRDEWMLVPPENADFVKSKCVR